MLYAKINPAATYTNQVSPFSATTTQCNYMTAYARPYAVGAEQTNFQVQFGLAIQLLVSQVGVQDTWIVIFADSEVWFIVRRARRQGRCTSQCETHG